jgi:hypothetical protein
MLEIALAMGAIWRHGTWLTAVEPATEVRTGVRVHLSGPAGHTIHDVDHLLLTLGGNPWVPEVGAWFKQRLLHSSHVLTQDGLQEVLDVLPAQPRLVVLGRAHSAFSVADRLLVSPESSGWNNHAVTIVTRGPVRVTYDSVAEALADGARITDDDVCPKTGKVFRLCGLRNDSAQRYFKARDKVDERLVVRQVNSDAEMHASMTSAHLTIAATGYRSKALDFFPEGTTIHPDGSLTDPAGQRYEGIRAMGLGCGSLRSEVSGGEPSYTGPVDGVWHYQAVVAPVILAGLRGGVSSHV